MERRAKISIFQRRTWRRKSQLGQVSGRLEPGSSSCWLVGWVWVEVWVGVENNKQDSNLRPTLSCKHTGVLDTRFPVEIPEILEIPLEKSRNPGKAGKSREIPKAGEAKLAKEKGKIEDWILERGKSRQFLRGFL